MMAWQPCWSVRKRAWRKVGKNRRFPKRWWLYCGWTGFHGDIPCGDIIGLKKNMGCLKRGITWYNMRYTETTSYGHMMIHLGLNIGYIPSYWRASNAWWTHGKKYDFIHWNWGVPYFQRNPNNSWDRSLRSPINCLLILGLVTVSIFYLYYIYIISDRWRLCNIPYAPCIAISWIIFQGNVSQWYPPETQKNMVHQDVSYENVWILGMKWIEMGDLPIFHSQKRMGNSASGHPAPLHPFSLSGHTDTADCKVKVHETTSTYNILMYSDQQFFSTWKMIHLPITRSTRSESNVVPSGYD